VRGAKSAKERKNILSQVLFDIVVNVLSIEVALSRHDFLLRCLSGRGNTKADNVNGFSF
jgi:hypothetical protein